MDLSGADLRSVVLSNADLSYADLSGANLRTAHLDGTNLRGTNLRNADLTGASLKGAWHHQETQWPEGFQPRRHRAKEVPTPFPNGALGYWAMKQKMRERPRQLSPPSIWEIESSWPSSSPYPYGNASSTSDWEDYLDWEDYCPISLFIRNSGESWQAGGARLEAWYDFIWADDGGPPWVTEKGAQLLSQSGLTGFVLRPALVTDLEGYDVDELGGISLPPLFRVDVVSTVRYGLPPYETQEITTDRFGREYELIKREFDEVTLDYASWEGGDFFMVRLKMFITENALDWLNRQGFNNFEIKPARWEFSCFLSLG